MRLRTKSYKKIFGALVAASMVTALAACGSNSAQNNGSKKGDASATIGVLLNGSRLGTAMASLVPQYEKSTGHKVNVLTYSEDQMRAKELVNLRSKSAEMDVYMTIPSREGPGFEAAGYYTPLKSYLDQTSSSYNVKGFSPAAMNSVSVDGKLIAIPMSVEGPVLYYRKDILQKLDIAVPTTLDELVAACKRIAADGDNSYVPITLRGRASQLTYTFGPFFHASGLEWATDGTPNFDSNAAVKAIKQYATLAGKYGPDGVLNYAFRESTDLFSSGGAVFEIESSNLMSAILDPDTSKVIGEVGVAPVPGSAPTVLSWGLAISKFSDNKDAAWNFVQWATSPKTQLKTAVAGFPPPRPELFENPKYAKKFESEVGKQFVGALDDISENGNPEPGPKGKKTPEMEKVIGTEIGRAIGGQLSAKDAAAAIQEQLKSLL